MLFVESEYVQGIAAFWQGQVNPARQHFERALERYRPERRPAHLLRYGLDPQVICLSRLGNTLWFLDDVEAARATRGRALELAREIAHPASRAVAQVFAALLALETGEVELLEELACALDARDSVHDAPQIRHAARLFRCYLQVLEGKTRAGLSEINALMDDPHSARHAPGMRAVQARVLVVAAQLTRDARAAHSAAERALKSAGSARLWLAEAHRVHAENAASLGSAPEDVAAELERALELARAQGAQLLARKAAASLRRLGLQRSDAYDLAAPE
jgi:hypothetical protein